MSAWRPQAALCLRCSRLLSVARPTLSSARPRTMQQAALLRQRGFHVQTNPLRNAPSQAATGSPGSAESTPSLEKPDHLDEAESAIWDMLVSELAPSELMVQDISGGCGSMYGIEITSEKFRGTTMLKQQRMVNSVLGDQMKGWHGVQLRTKVPS